MCEVPFDPFPGRVMLRPSVVFSVCVGMLTTLACGVLAFQLIMLTYGDATLAEIFGWLGLTVGIPTGINVSIYLEERLRA